MLASGKINPRLLLESCKYYVGERCLRINSARTKLQGKRYFVGRPADLEEKLSWGWNSVARADELYWRLSFCICRNELRLGDEVYWLARDYEPRLGVIMSCFRETDINVFGYFYSVGSVCTNNHIPKHDSIPIPVGQRNHRVWYFLFFPCFWNYE